MNNLNRRSLLKSAGISLVACSMGIRALAGTDKLEPPQAGDMTYDHGIVERILLIYEEAQRRRLQRQSLPVDVVLKTAGINKRSVENYHQRLEEEFMFGYFEKSQELSQVVKTLRGQHEQGRKLTAQIISLCKSTVPGNLDDYLALIQSLSQFVLMYRRHLALEDSLLLPKFTEALKEQGNRSLDERFAKKARKLAADNALKGVLPELESLEKELGLL